MDYLKVSKGYFIDPVTFEFIPDDGGILPENFIIPFFLWDNFCLDMYNAGLTHPAVYEFDLNNLHFKCMNWFPFPNKIEGSQECTLVFKDKKSASDTTITVAHYPHFAYNYMSYGYGRDDDETMVLAYVTYIITIADKVIELQEEYKVPRRGCLFNHVTELMRVPTVDKTKEEFYYGLKSEPYSIMYRGKWLKNKSYAFLFGMWAVLLTDKMEFDSLAVLDGVVDGALQIRKFVYTVNPHIVKLMTLLR